MKEYGAKCSLLISKPLLTERHRQKCLDWAHAAGDMDWNRIIFSDESTIRLNQLKRCVWNLPGKRKVFRAVKYPIKVNIWGCFSCNDFGRICCFRENLKADLLCRIYKRYLLSTARDHFGRNSTNWALQEDNDPKYTPQLAKQWRSKYEVKTNRLTINVTRPQSDRKRLEASQNEFGKEKSSNLQVFSFRDKKRMESLSKRSNNQSCTKYEKLHF